MKTSDFTVSLLVDQSPKEAFNAIKNMRAWWSQEIEGDTDKLQAEFSYHYQDIHFCKMKLIELIPDKKVTWLVTDNFFSFTQDKSEWINTKLCFEIVKKGNQTEIRFTHEGLVPSYECYDVCFDGWTNYVNNSLHSLITTGKGQPNPKEGRGFNAELAEKWKIARAEV